MDEIDARILDLLGEQGRLSFRDLGELVRLSPTATADRVRRLERSGAIAGYRAVIDRRAVGYLLEAFVDVRLGAGVDAERAEELIRAVPEVIELHDVTGTFDYQARVIARSPEGLHQTLYALRRDVPLADTQTRLVLRDVSSRPPAPAAG